MDWKCCVWMFDEWNGEKKITKKNKFQMHSIVPTWDKIAIYVWQKNWRRHAQISNQRSSTQEYRAPIQYWDGNETYSSPWYRSKSIYLNEIDCSFCCIKYKNLRIWKWNESTNLHKAQNDLIWIHSYSLCSPFAVT